MQQASSDYLENSAPPGQRGAEDIDVNGTKGDTGATGATGLHGRAGKYHVQSFAGVLDSLIPEASATGIKIQRHLSYNAPVNSLSYRRIFEIICRVAD